MDGKTKIAKFLLKAALAAAIFELALFLNYYYISGGSVSSKLASSVSSYIGPPKSQSAEVGASLSKLSFFGSVLNTDGSVIKVEGGRPDLYKDVKSGTAEKEKRSLDLSSARIFIQGEKKDDVIFRREVDSYVKQAVKGGSGASVEPPYQYVLSQATPSSVVPGDMVLADLHSEKPSSSGVYKVFRLIVIKAAKTN